MVVSLSSLPGSPSELGQMRVMVLAEILATFSSFAKIIWLTCFLGSYLGIYNVL
jgi:hypothetical protein